jgi:hypothetical protein
MKAGIYRVGTEASHPHIGDPDQTNGGFRVLVSQREECGQHAASQCENKSRARFGHFGPPFFGILALSPTDIQAKWRPGCRIICDNVVDFPCE